MSSGRWLVVCAVASLSWAATPAPSEAQVKAEFVERFTRFIEWPEPPSADSAFVVCVWGESPLGEQLEQLTRRKIQNRAVQLKRLRDYEGPNGCHILYLAPGARDQVARIAEGLRGKPILSVGDAAGFAEQGLVINLFVDEAAHVRFEINPEAVHASGLKISAKLMTLAKQTSGRPRE